MNYIVLDLEWNQASSVQYENPRIPFEIIEIGAIKLDEQFNIIDEYSSIIKPRLYKKLHYKIREMLNYDETILRKGRPFDMVCREFVKWCGEDFTFCTWGPLDLYNLQQNMDYYYLKSLPYPLKFYNIQDIFASLQEEEHPSTKLEKAVTSLDIDIDKSKPFHAAINDARYSAYVLAKLSIPNFEDLYTIDYYHHPVDKDSEIRSYHSNYTEYISREFNNKRSVMEDKDITTLRCYKCKRRLSKKVKWFVSTPTTSLCAGRCWTHGFVCGKIKFKNSNEDNVFVVKTTEGISKDAFENIKIRQDELRLKRKQKRNNNKQSTVTAASQK